MRAPKRTRKSGAAMKGWRSAIRRVTAERRFASARFWSNDELRRLCPIFTGDVVNVSGWDDRDKEGSYYRHYFSSARSYSITNYRGDRGLQGLSNEYFLDLTAEPPEHLRGRFDVAFNHTTLEHIFEVRKAFANLCTLSRDVVVVVVPFAQVQHEGLDWKDYWRFTPTCMRALFSENELKVVYESASSQRDAAIYLLFAGSRNPERWSGKLPSYTEANSVGKWIGRGVARTAIARARNVLLRRREERG